MISNKSRKQIQKVGSKNNSDKILIENVIAKLNRAFEENDHKTIISMFADSEDSFMYGTAKTEAFKTWQSIRGGFEDLAKTSSSYKLVRDYTIRNLMIEGDIAWYAKDIPMEVHNTDGSGEMSIMDLRVTGVLSRTPQGWKIIQRHVSTPEAGIEPGSN